MHPHPSPLAKTPVLTAEGLVFGHAGPSGPPVLDQLTMVLLPGVTWVGGGEDSGKTSLLQVLAGAVRPGAFQGQVCIQRVSLVQNREAYRQLAGWLDPRDTARDQQTARQIFAGLQQLHVSFSLEALQEHIAGLSLAPHLDKALYMLSSGTRRKVLMAAAMAAMAPVTLLDQPFMALDRPSSAYLLHLLAQAAQQSVRAWVVADYEAPPGIALAGTVALQPGRRE